jgi:hypothetical protein
LTSILGADIVPASSPLFPICQFLLTGRILPKRDSYGTPCDEFFVSGSDLRRRLLVSALGPFSRERSGK